MENTAVFSCCIGTTDPMAPLGVEIWLDQEQIFNLDHVDTVVEFKHEFIDSAGEHQLQFVMKNKTQDHTQIDDQGNIVRDASLTISAIAFEEIELGQTFVDQAVYQHDFNGTQPLTDDSFFGIMGCNGTVSFSFTTPIYLWLLEHM